ncbi:MAG TPA: hypothetical protein VGT24_02875 [Candidatus Acidoferrales bacterium]|nr:hypothetical protein [Candidatus Acidoferrales bacterium]
MSESHHKRLTALVVLAVAILVGALYLVARPMPLATVPGVPPAQTGQTGSMSSTVPKVTWSQSQMTVPLSPGESTSSQLSFTSNLGMNNVVVEPVPEIAQFLTIQPNSFASVPAGQAELVQVLFSIPEGTALGTFLGTVHIRIGSSTLPQTLKIVIQTGKLFSTSSYSIMYPADWTFSQADPSQTGFIPPGKQVYLGNEYVGDIVTEAISKSATSDLQSFYANNAIVNLFANSQAQTSYSVNGFPAVKFTGVYGMVPTDIVAVDKGTTVVEVSDVGQLHQSDGFLDLMVNTLH